MLFHISPSVADSLEAGNAETLDCLLRIIDSRRRGLLVLYASKKTFDRIAFFFANVSRNFEAKLVKTISKDIRETRDLVRTVSRIVFVTMYAKPLRIRFGKYLCTTPLHLNRTNYLYYPILLAENLTDAKLYLKGIAENYVKDIPLSLHSVKIAARQQLGGGNTTYQQYEHYADEAIELCLCIVDSDRGCPAEGLGDTAKLVLNVDSKAKPPNCTVFVIDMYSAENILPLHVLQEEFVKNKSPEQAAEFDKMKALAIKSSWKYLPLKKGVKGNELRLDKAFSHYWKKELGDLGIKIPCCDEKKCTCVIIPSLSTKTLANAVLMDSNQWYKGLNNELNAEISKIYKDISITLRSWFCVGKEIRA